MAGDCLHSALLLTAAVYHDDARRSSRGWGKPTQLIAGDDEHDAIKVRGIKWLDE
jgi:hypothetical protein